MTTILAIALAASGLSADVAAGPAGAGGGEGGLRVPLTVTERAGVDRTGELAAGGVPLPQGAVRDTGGLGVVDANGRAVSAQFDVLTRWPADGSIRWMLVQFPVTVKAGESATFTLTQGGGNPKPPVALKVEDGTDTVTVDTGAVRFTVRKKNFALLDTVTTLDAQDSGREIRTLGPRLCGNGFTMATADGKTFTMAADAESKVTLEDVGPLRATIRADGRHRSADGAPSFAYRVRIYATAASPAVRVQYTFTHDVGPFDNTPVEVKELALALQPKFRAPTYGFGTIEDTEEPKTGTSVTGRLAEGPGRLSIPNSRNYVLQLPAWITPRNKTLDRAAPAGYRLGWFYLADGDLEGPAIVAAVRWFWQLNPKALAVTPDGSMKIELVPADAVEPAHIYRGMAKTHDLLFTFSDGVAGGAWPGPDLSVGFQQPLHVRCAPSWYCQDTLGFGRLASADCPAVGPQFAGFVGAVEDGFARQIEVIRNDRGIIRDEKRGIDSYGMIHFGDGFHHRSGSGHRGLQWDCCYYGYTHLLAMQFARSGSDAMFDTLREAAACEGDVCVAWAPHLRHDELADPDQALRIAAPRVNPGAYHVGGFGRFDNAPSGSWNFYHPNGMMEAFYLTGDRRYQDTGLANLYWALRSDGYDMYNNPRSVGAGLRAMVYGYLATGDMSFLHVGREIARKAERFYRVHGHFAPIRNSIFMCANALEGLCLYHELTGDPVLGKVLPQMVADHASRFARDPASLTYAYMNLYTARLSGDDELRKRVETALAGVTRVGIATGNHHVKDFAASRRPVPLIFWQLSEAAHTPAGRSPWGAVDLGPDRPDRVEVPALTRAPKLDGTLSPGEWDRAATIDLVFNPDPTRQPRASTGLRLGYDKDNLYLAVRATEPHLGDLRLAVKEDGGPVYSDDCVEIYAGPNERLVGLKLVVNAAGVRMTGMRGHERAKATAPAPGDFPVAARQADGAWVLEVTIPWSRIGIAEARPGVEVAFNVLRFRMGTSPAKTGESSTWHGTSNQLESIGTLVLGR